FRSGWQGGSADEVRCFPGTRRALRSRGPDYFGRIAKSEQLLAEFKLPSGVNVGTAQTAPGKGVEVRFITPRWAESRQMQPSLGRSRSRSLGIALCQSFSYLSSTVSANAVVDTKRVAAARRILVTGEVLLGTLFPRTRRRPSTSFWRRAPRS